MLNQSNKFREFLGGNGNFLPLIDALDGFHNESMNTKVLQLLGYTAQSAVGNFIKLVLHKNLSLTLDLFWTFQGHAFVC